MKPNIVVIICTVVLLVACGTSEQKQAETTSNQVLPKMSPVDDVLQRKRALAQFDALERIFDNQNYLITQNKDSSYIYFSRLNSYLIYVQSYKLVKGDSTQLKIDTIRLNEKNEVVLNYAGTSLQLKQATDFSADWVKKGTDSTEIQFKKIDRDNLQLIKQAGNKLVLKKTITLSTFLVRSYYDYQHGTKLAFDSTNFTKK